MGDVFDRGKIADGSEVNVNDFSLYRARYGEDRRVYMRDLTGYLEDVLGRYVASKTVLDGLNVRTPAMEYDRENSRILIEDVGEEARPVIHADTEVDVEEYVDAVLGKYVVGDRDVTGNVLVDAEDELYVVDFVGAGEMELASIDDVYGHVVDRVEKNMQRAGREVSLDRAAVRGRAGRLAERLDVEERLEELYTHELLDGFGDMDVFVSNLVWLENEAGNVLA